MAFRRFNAGGKMQTATTEKQTQVLKAQMIKEAFDLFDTDGFGEIYCRGKNSFGAKLCLAGFGQDCKVSQRCFVSQQEASCLSLVSGMKPSVMAHFDQLLRCNPLAI